MVLKSLLGNVTKTSAQRVARSLETLDEIMDGIRKDLDQKKSSGHHGTKDPEQAVKIILTDLMNGKVFHHTPGRCGYPSFKNKAIEFTNKPLDLQTEHLNFSLRMVLKSLLGNVTERSAQRVARSLETLDEIMDGIRKDLDQKKSSGHHGTKDPEQAVKIILTDLMNGKVFHHTPGRCGYPSF